MPVVGEKGGAVEEGERDGRSGGGEEQQSEEG